MHFSDEKKAAPGSRLRAEKQITVAVSTPFVQRYLLAKLKMPAKKG
jgi:hypothetical protein